MSLSPIPLLAADSRSASIIRELDLYISRLEVYERGGTDAVPYVPAQTLMRANAEIARLNDVIAKNDVHLANLINARKPEEPFCPACNRAGIAHCAHFDQCGENNLPASPALSSHQGNCK